MTIHDALHIGRAKPALWPRLADCIQPDGRVLVDAALAAEIEQVRGLGDVVAKAVKPLVRVSDALLGTDWQHCGGCADRQRRLNALVSVG